MRPPSCRPLVLALLLLAACAPRPPQTSSSAPTSAAREVVALHDAARAGDLAEVRRLIEQVGVPVDAGDRYGATALIAAADRGHLDVVRWLLATGADVNRRETFFNTSAFDHSLWNAHVDVALALLAAGADQREDALDAAAQQDVPALARAAVAAGPIRASAVARLSARADLAPELRDLLREATTRPDPDPPRYTTDELAQFEGRFETYDPGAGADVEARVEREDDGLRLSLPGTPPLHLAASGEREFRSADGAVRASFWGRLGSVESLTVQRDGAPPLQMRQSVAEPVGAAVFTAPAAAPEGASGDGNWPRFRGPAASGVGEGTARVSWNMASRTGVLWQVDLPGLGNSSPIVWGDRVIVTTAVATGIAQDVRTGLTGAGDAVDESVEHSWRVMAFDKRSGAPLWDTEVARAIPLTQRHFKASQASPSPATDGSHVVAAFPTGGLACLDLQGHLLWHVDLGGLNASSPNDPGMQWGFASSPVIWRDRVILVVDTYDDPYVAAWELSSGKPLWRTPRSGPPSWSTPLVARGAGRDELVVNGSVIRAYDPRDGSELWSLGPNSELVIASPVAGAGVVYVSAGYAPVKPIYAVRLEAHGALEGAARDAALAWSQEQGGAYMPTPLLYRGLLYVVHHNGRIVAYDAASGEAIYKERFSRAGTFTSSPIAADGKLYVGTEEGLVYVIEAGPEYREIAVNEMGQPVMATPAISAGALYVRTPHRLVALGP